MGPPPPPCPSPVFHCHSLLPCPAHLPPLLPLSALQVVVRLLLGEVPERSEFTIPDLRQALVPYFDLAQAVRGGDLNEFRSVVVERAPRKRKNAAANWRPPNHGLRQFPATCPRALLPACQLPPLRPLRRRPAPGHGAVLRTAVPRRPPGASHTPLPGPPPPSPAAPSRCATTPPSAPTAPTTSSFACATTLSGRGCAASRSPTPGSRLLTWRPSLACPA